MMDVFFYLAVDGTLNQGEHLLPLAVYHALNHLLVVRNVLHVLCDESACSPLFVVLLFHRLLLLTFDGAKVQQNIVPILDKNCQ